MNCMTFVGIPKAIAYPSSCTIIRVRMCVCVRAGTFIQKLISVHIPSINISSSPVYTKLFLCMFSSRTSASQLCCVPILDELHYPLAHISKRSSKLFLDPFTAQYCYVACFHHIIHNLPISFHLILPCVSSFQHII